MTYCACRNCHYGNPMNGNTVYCRRENQINPELYSCPAGTPRVFDKTTVVKLIQSVVPLVSRFDIDIRERQMGTILCERSDRIQYSPKWGDISKMPVEYAKLEYIERDNCYHLEIGISSLG